MRKGYYIANVFVQIIAWKLTMMLEIEDIAW